MSYDVVVVGAGPAGLSSARTLARLGYRIAVIERALEPGALSHACNAIIAQTPGMAPVEQVLGGLYFPQVDLMVPASLLISRDIRQRCVAPGGQEFAVSAATADAPAALIDKAGLLRLLAGQARTAGADFFWGTTATALLQAGERVCGVRTSAGDISSDIVIVAEGAARQLCADGNLYHENGQHARRLLVLTQELDAPAVGPAHLGRIVTLGRPYSSAPAGFGTLLLPAPRRAVMTFSLLVDDLDCATAASNWQYLAEYAHDPRIAGLLDGACVVQRSSFLIPLSAPPDRIVRDGLLAVGDAVTPVGYLGILPAIYLGRQAALVAAGALDEGDTSAAALAEYDDFFRTLVLPGLQAEAAALEVLLRVSDDEIDRLCSVLNWLHLPAPFFQPGGGVPADTLRWLGQQMALNAEDVSLVAQVYGAPQSTPASFWLPVQAASEVSLS